MNLPRQIVAISLLNFKTLPQRFWPSMVIVVGMACVVGVLLSMLAMTTGLAYVFLAAGDPSRAIVLSAGAQNEFGSSMPRSSVQIVMDAPGIARDAQGAPIADPEILIGLPANRKRDNIPSNVLLRGFGPKALELMPKFKLVAGRMLRPGRREMIAGIGLQDQFKGFAIGDRVITRDGEWPIVGAFTTGRDVMEGELMADADTVMPTVRRTGFNSVIVRLASPSAFFAFQKSLTTNPAVAVSIERQPDYFLRVTGTLFRFLPGAVAPCGRRYHGNRSFIWCGQHPVFFRLAPGPLKSPPSVLWLRCYPSRYIRNTRGHRAYADAAGALIGAVTAWSLYNGVQDTYGSNVFYMTRLSPKLIGVAILWALAIGLLGALLPSIRAASLPVATALRST